MELLTVEKNDDFYLLYRGEDLLATIAKQKYLLNPLSKMINKVNKFLNKRLDYDYVIVKYKDYLRHDCLTDQPYVLPSIEVYMWNDSNFAIDQIPKIESFHYQNYLANSSFVNSDIEDYLKYEYCEYSRGFKLVSDKSLDYFYIENPDSKTMFEYENIKDLKRDLKILKRRIKFFHKNIDY